MKPITDRLSPTITALVMVTVAVALFYIVVTPIRPFVATHLALNAGAFLGPEPWQILTSLFVHVDPLRWDPLESTCRHASLSIL